MIPGGTVRRWCLRGAGVAAAAALPAALLGAAHRGGAAPAPVASVRLQHLFDAEQPVGVVHLGRRRFVVEKTGVLREVRVTTFADGTPTWTPGAPFVDLRAQVSTANEQGLLGAAFSPRGDELYLDYTDRRGDTRVVAYALAGEPVRPGRARTLLTVRQPFPNHNGGALAVGSDGLLWIGLGDGGSAGDPGDRAQDPHQLLGKLLRIDPRPAQGRQYGIPSGNAFAAGGGRPEIWALGLRNPWRFSLDEVDATVWIGDVGQAKWEEIDALPIDAVAANLGWKVREGKHAYGKSRRRTAASYVDPVFEYAHGDDGCSVTGGVVYRGEAIPALRGRYVFADYCAGRLRALTRSADPTRYVVDELGAQQDDVVSFDTDTDGELLVTSLTAGVFRLLPLR